MSLIGNLICFLLGGFWMGLGWILTGILMAISIIGIPFALQYLKLAGISLAPIGKKVVSKDIARAL